MIRFELTCPGHQASSSTCSSGYKYCSGCTMKKTFVQSALKNQKIVHRHQPKRLERSGCFCK